MIQEIKYGGQSANPSDYESADGSMAASINLIHEDGALHPIFQPLELFSIEPDEQLLCIHSTPAFKHYIIHCADGSLRWQDDDGNTSPIDGDTVSDITDTSCLGNTVCIMSGSGIRYYLWSTDDSGASTDDSGASSYVQLSPNLPELKLSFGLQGQYVGSQRIDIGSGWIDANGNVADEHVEELSSGIHAAINKLMSEEVTDKGRFAFPFFVRYAYRLFDGSLTMHSAPILMIPCSDGRPIVDTINIVSGLNHLFSAQAKLPSLSLDAQIQGTPDDILRYSDIIESVDIFVSQPIYGYDPDGKINLVVSGPASGSFGIFKNTNSSIDNHCLWDIANSAVSSNTPTAHWIMPDRKSSDLSNEIKNCSSFYFVHSFSLSDLPTTRSVIDIPGFRLNTLTTQEAMTDDFDSHDIIRAVTSHEYNSRLMLIGVSKRLFPGYFNMAFADRIPYPLDDTVYSPFVISSTVVTIKREGRTVKLLERIPGGFGIVSARADASQLFVPYFYHPDPAAVSVDIFGSSNGVNYKLTLPLKPHGMLNGAFYFGGLESQSLVQTSASLLPINQDSTIHLPNKIYVSELENPFFFPAQSIVSVGSGSVVGVASAAQALSQGQFGSFPLYAFATDGVWALTVSQTGSFSAVQPIARDVCVSPQSITQLDGAVLFASDRGIMLVSGSSVRCISDSIGSDTPFDLSHLQNISRLSYMLGIGECVHSMPNFPFSQFLKGCRMAFDYISQRVIVFNPTIEDGLRSYAFAYVYSIKSGEWGMMLSNISHTVNSYPKAIAQSFDGGIVSLSDPGEEVSHGLFVTRPIKFGKAGIYKSVHSILQRGYFQSSNNNDDVCTVLYASRDLFHWFLIGSSQRHQLRLLQGTPYKYFRIAGVTNFTPDKSLYGATIDVVPRELSNLH